MRLLLLASAVLAFCTLGLGTAIGQDSPAPPPTRIDYSILGQPANAAKANLTDQQRASIAEILDQRVNDLVAADPGDRDAIVAKSNAAIESLLSEAQKQALAASLASGKLQFNFHKQRWTAVLKWFADQAGLSLFMDAEPPGLFTYSDTREFTPAEAIDLLNSVLLSKGFTLIRREGMLTVVDTSQGVPYDLVEQVPLDKLSQYGRFELVTVEFELEGRPVDAVVEAVTPLIGNYGQVVPLPAAGKILVTETTSRLKTVSLVIQSVPVPKKPPEPAKPAPPPPMVQKTYAAPGLDSNEVIEVLTFMYPDASFKFDPTGPAIHCKATEATQALVEPSIAKLVANVSGDSKPRMKPYPVPTKLLSTLPEQLTLAHPNLPIDVDTAKSRLLVVATAAEHAAVRETLETLGASPLAEPLDGEQNRVAVYPVDEPSVSVVAALLEEILPGATVVPDVNRVAVRGTDAQQQIAATAIEPFAKSAADRPSLSFYPLDGPLSAELMSVLTSAVPEASISYLPESKKLSVVAKLKDHQRVKETLAQITEVTAASQAKTIAYYPVSDHQRARFLSIQAELPVELKSMLLMTDAMPGEFIAWGTESQQQQLAELLETLKRNEPTTVTAPQKLPVTVAAPDDLINRLKSRFPGVEMVFNEYTRELYVWAEGEKFDSIRNAQQTITATMAPRQELVMIPYPLQHADAEDVLTLLTGMRPDLTAAADPKANRILVSAPLEQHARYKALIEQLDAKPNQPNEPLVESYPLKSIDPATALTILAPLFPELTLNADSANRRIVVSGTTHEHRRLVAAMERIDVPPAQQDRRLETYELGAADATQVTAALAQLAPNAIVSVNADSRRVFVWGDEQAQQVVAQAMQHLAQSDPRQSRSIKAYPLPQGTGASALTMLSPVAEQATLSLDANSQNLVAFATAEEHQQIAAAVEALHRDLDRSGERTTVVYKLETTTPATVYAVLGSLLPGASLVPDAPTASLVATASPQDHATIRSVIDQIEHDPGTQRTLKTYRLPRGAGSPALTMLQSIAGNASLSLDTNGDHLIAWATTDEHAALKLAVEGLNQGLTRIDDKTVQIYRFQKSTPTVAYSVLTTLVPEATLAIDANAELLVATASPKDHAKIKLVAEQLEQGSEVARSLKAYAIPKGAGATAVSILQPVAPEASLSLDATYENLIVWATDQEQQMIAAAVTGLQRDLIQSSDKTTAVYRFEKSSPATAYRVLGALVPNATLALDTDTSVIAATAVAFEHERIQALVEQLENDPQAARTMKAYPIPKSAAPNATAIMQPVAPDASISIDATNENLIAFATDTEHVAIAAAVEGLRNDLVNANDKSTRVYRFLQTTPQAAYTVLTTLVPAATLAVDEATSVLVATATPQQHQLIDSVVTQIEEDPESTRTMKAYPLPRGAAATAVTIMQPVAADATFSLDDAARNLIVWATAAEHVTIAAAIESLRQDLVNPSGENQSVAVYPLDPELISADSLVESFDEATVDGLSIMPNLQTNSLIVHGGQADQARFAETIETITSQLKKTNQLQTQVYRFTTAAPSVAITTLTPLFPDATFAIDQETSVLVATATARQQETIATVVEQIDTADSSGSQTTQVYRFHRATADTVAAAFEMLAPKAKIGFDRGSNVVIATAAPQDHQIFRDAAAQVDGRAGSGGIVKVVRLGKVKATVAETAMQVMIDAQSIEADVQANEEDNSLVMVAAPDQMKLLEAAIKEIDTDDRRFEVFEIVYNDLYRAEQSARDMFDSMPEPARPHIGSDYNASKLFVRGTENQVEQIRSLLTTMGEPLRSPQKNDYNNPHNRTVTLPGNAGQVIEQVRSIWPRLRRNEIQLIVPSDRTIQPIVPSGDSWQTDPQPLVPPENTQGRRRRQPGDAIAGRSNRAQPTAANRNGIRLVVFQNTTRAAGPQQDQQPAAANDPPQPTDPPAGTAKPPPILMVADGDQITISSADTEALDRLESLLRAMGGNGRGQSNSDFAVFLLRNMGASDAQELLSKLVKELPFDFYNQSHRGGVRNMVVVADDRLNALVVYGDRQAREIVEQLLQVLDSQGLPDPLNVYKTEIIQFQHVHVSRAMAILRSVYEPQLSPGMGKKPIEIPEGVTTTVASLLTQINAANRGPILTLDMDATTNSMIMRAPPELRAEIKEFAERLDQQGADSRNRSVRVIQLKQGKSALIQAALKEFIGNQPIVTSATVPSPAAASAAETP